MKIPLDARFLAVYSGVVTAVLLVVLLGAFAPAKNRVKFDELEVQRINIVEPDGTLRLAISNKARFPGFIMKRKERSYDRSTAGVLFFNDEGTENGGLIFGGRKGSDGKVSAGGSLTFDQYEQDQVVQIVQNESDGQRLAGFKVNDAPETPIDFDAFDKLNKLEGAEKEAELERLRKNGKLLRQRIFVGKRSDRSALIVLRDREERERIVIEVAPDGSPSMRFLNEEGKVVSRLPPAVGK
ncbi:MAG: hypothetical protein HY921_07790 [Elusimicrobia bacterium]|nr:hypothetical protein [Elusimicrobiota bacterium]